ncbi:hypothetical protein [Embleya sp. MST-111070]|uniref:hypothetical protein n=1 Tax=Embleya sp. MST-111070 TaxID=3398231 RepID=UPI003F733A39
MSGRMRYEGPATVMTEAVRFDVTARLTREPDGAWHGEIRTPRQADLRDLERASTRMLWIGDCASSFTLDAVHDMRAAIGGAGHAPFT